MKNNQKILSICTLLSSLLLTSCGDKVPSNLKEINDDNISNNFSTINLVYASVVPGSGLTYMTLFKGHDESKYCGYHISKEERYHTYLIDYSFKNDIKYYFIYFKNSYLDKFKEYYKENMDSDHNWNFTSDEYVIDSKYLEISNKLKMNDYLIYETSSLDNVTYSFNGYFLGGIFESRNITIKEDVSMNKTLNKDVPIFNKMMLKYDINSKKLEEYSNGWLDSNIKDNNYYFNFSDKKLEAYSQDFTDLMYLNVPFFGHKNRKISGGDAYIENDYVVLPRYFKNEESKIIDYLDETYVYKEYFEEDVYGDLKKEFKDAFISLKEEGSKYGYFDLNKVKEIIHNHSND